MWADLVAWFQSPGGARVLQTAIIPALVIVVAGLLAAVIARSAVSATTRRAERVEAASVVAGLVVAARLAADAGDDSSRRRAARLRLEADVRARMLPLPGAGLAADWASARTDALLGRGGEPPATTDLAELRDRLVEWVGSPSRARRLFSAPVTPSAAPPAARPTAEEPRAATAVVETPAPADEPAAEQPAPPEPEQRDPEWFARPGATPGPRRSPAEPEPLTAAAEPEPEPAVAAAATATPLPSATIPEGLPAWQRTRAVERLQQERSRGRTAETPTANEDVPVSTAPVALQRTHRAEAAAAAAEREEAVRLEAHQQARHARPSEETPTGAAPAATATPAPAWLDTYDDEAHVTQNLDLKTPPPVAASAVRDRGPTGDDLVPRS